MHASENLKEHIEGIYSHTEETLASVRSQAPHSGLFDTLSVECYDSHSLLPHIATTTLKQAHTLVVTPWDKEVIGNIEKAISNAYSFASVSSDGDSIMVVFPPLTTEQKEEVAKLVGEKHEESRIALRMVREKTMKHIEQKKKDGDIGEDGVRKEREVVEKEVKRANDVLKEMAEKKKQQILL